MKLPFIVLFISMAAWLFPPFKNLKTRYFSFFYIMAIMDPVKVIFQSGLGYLNQFPSVLLSALNFIVLIEPKKAKIIASIFCLIMSLPILFFIIPVYYPMLTALTFNVGILYVISLRLAEKMLYDKSLNLFLTMLIVYEAISFFRRVA